MLAAVGLTAQDVARRVTEWAAALPGARIEVEDDVENDTVSSPEEQAR